ncbi:hypothetical protein ACFLUZ_05415 [Chloroflexota bacterium]
MLIHAYAKLLKGEFDGVILAAAAILRLGWQERITEYLPTKNESRYDIVKRGHSRANHQRTEGQTSLPLRPEVVRVFKFTIAYYVIHPSEEGVNITIFHPDNSSN